MLHEGKNNLLEIWTGFHLALKALIEGSFLQILFGVESELQEHGNSHRNQSCSNECAETGESDLLGTVINDAEV